MEQEMHYNPSYEDEEAMEVQAGRNVSTQDEGRCMERPAYTGAVMVCDILSGGLAPVENMPGIPASRPGRSQRNFRGNSRCHSPQYMLMESVSLKSYIRRCSV